MKQWLAVVAAVLILAGNPAKAQTRKDGPMAKVTHSLAALHEQYVAHMAQRSAVSFHSNDPLVRVVDDRVVVDAIASGDVNALKSDLMFLGMDDAVTLAASFRDTCLSGPFLPQRHWPACNSRSLRWPSPTLA